MLTYALESCSVLWDACDADTKSALRMVDKATAAVGLKYITLVKIRISYLEPEHYRKTAYLRAQSPRSAASFLNKLPRLQKLCILPACYDAFDQGDAGIGQKAWIAFDAYVTEMLVQMHPVARNLIIHCELTATLSSLRNKTVNISKGTLALLFQCLPSLVHLDLNIYRLLLEHLVTLRCCKQLQCLNLRMDVSYPSLAEFPLKFLVHTPQLLELSVPSTMPCTLQTLYTVARLVPQLQRLRIGKLQEPAFLDARCCLSSSEQRVRSMHAAVTSCLRNGNSIDLPPVQAANQQSIAMTQPCKDRSEKPKAKAASSPQSSVPATACAKAAFPVLPALTILELAVDWYDDAISVPTLAMLQLMMPQLACLRLRCDEQPHKVSLTLHGRKDACVQRDGCMQKSAGQAAGNSSSSHTQGCLVASCIDAGGNGSGGGSSEQGYSDCEAPSNEAVGPVCKNPAATSLLQLMARLQPLLVESRDSYSLRVCNCVAAVAELQPRLLPMVQRLDCVLSSTGLRKDWRLHAKQQLVSTIMPDGPSACPAMFSPICQADAVQYSVHGGMLRGLPLPLLEGLSWDGVHALDAALPHATHLLLRLSCYDIVCGASSDDDSDKGSDDDSGSDSGSASGMSAGAVAAGAETRAESVESRIKLPKCPVHWVVLRMGQALMALLQALPRIARVDLAVRSYESIPLKPATVQALVRLVETLSQHTQVVQLGLSGFEGLGGYEGNASELFAALHAHLRAHGMRVFNITKDKSS